MLQSKQNMNNGSAVMNEVTFGEGKVPGRGERWPFSTLKRGKYFECADLTLYTAIRTAASRAQKKLKRKFTVRKLRVPVKEGEPHTVIRVFRE